MISEHLSILKERWVRSGLAREASTEQGRIEIGYEETETEAEDILSSRNHIGKTKSMCFLLDTVDMKVNIYILISSE